MTLEEGDTTDARLGQTNECKDMVESIKTHYSIVGADLGVLEKKVKSIQEGGVTVIPRGTATAFKPDILTPSIAAGEVKTWMDKWKEY